jgi:uncharacterized damage-inducible protein DinB
MINDAPAKNTTQREPWLRGTKQDVPAVPRAVLHALELAAEDLHRWCDDLTDPELQASPSGLPPAAFHLRHIARSLDRLLSYAEGHNLSDAQLAALETESDPVADRRQLFAELQACLAASTKRVLALASSDFEAPRVVGKKALPTTLGGLLVHVADHTQRHVGQAITTAKLLLALRPRR